MNVEKTKNKLSKLSDGDLECLYDLVLDEKSKRWQYLSNTENTPREQCKALSEFFANAWIH